MFRFRCFEFPSGPSMVHAGEIPFGSGPPGSSHFESKPRELGAINLSWFPTGRMGRGSLWEGLGFGNS